MVSWIIAAVLGAAAVGFAFGFAVAAMIAAARDPFGDVESYRGKER